MPFPLYILFGILPSIIWLLFYLRKDTHPESKRMILKIFFYGMLISLPVLLVEIGVEDYIDKTSLNFPPIVISILYWFLGVAFVEEFFKYLVVRGKVFKSSEFDEPADVMIYMIVAALGFAALENILYLFGLAPGEFFFTNLHRFLGAVFLHALCSAILGYFLALSLFYAKNRGKLLITGISIATLLHGLFNFSIMEIEGGLAFVIPILILLSLAVFITFAFKNIKKLKSVCKIY